MRMGVNDSILYVALLCNIAISNSALFSQALSSQAAGLNNPSPFQLSPVLAVGKTIENTGYSVFVNLSEIA
jgi:hypothetical protein